MQEDEVQSTIDELDEIVLALTGDAADATSTIAAAGMRASGSDATSGGAILPVADVSTQKTVWVSDSLQGLAWAINVAGVPALLSHDIKSPEAVPEMVSTGAGGVTACTTLVCKETPLATMTKKEVSKWRKKLVTRRDTPVVRESGRGSLARALMAGLPQNKKEALDRLKRDEVAASGKGPRDSRWRTWCRLHRNWLGDEPVLPLTLHSIAAVTAQLKEGKYSAAADYVSTAKAYHLRKFEWTTMLARQQTVCVRSALRGIGAAKQCQEILLDDFVKGAKKIQSNKKTPLGLHRVGVVAYFFMLREIEVGTMLYESVAIHDQLLIVSIFLSASKTDPCALSVTRRWGCVCDEGVPDAARCPYHAAAEQKEELRQKFGDRVDDEGFPFAPTQDGDAVTKDRMCDCIEDVAAAAGLET